MDGGLMDSDGATDRQLDRQGRPGAANVYLGERPVCQCGHSFYSHFLVLVVGVYVCRDCQCDEFWPMDVVTVPTGGYL